MLAPYLQLTTLPESVAVAFRFQVNGTSNPDAIVPKSQGVLSVTRSGVGIFVITFAEKFPVFVGLREGKVMAAAVGNAHDLNCAPGDYVPSTGVLTVTVVDRDAAVAIEPTDNDWVFVEALFCRRSQLAPQGALP